MTTAHETCPLTPKQLPDFLLHVATVRPVMILGAPGIGKTALVQQFADLVGLPCVSLLGSQLAPEDLLACRSCCPTAAAASARRRSSPSRRPTCCSWTS